MSYALRITRTGEELKPFWERVAAVTVRLIAYEHTDGERTHCHALVEGVTVSTDTMKNWIKAALQVKTFPKQDWSFKAADQDGKYITYMSKGTLDPIFTKGYDPEEVRRLKGTWIDYRAALSDKRAKEKLEFPKLRVPELLDEIEKRFHAQEHNAETMDRVMDVVISIARQVIYVENKAIVGRHKFRDFVDTVMARNFDKYPWIANQINFMRYR